MITNILERLAGRYYSRSYLWALARGNPAGYTIKFDHGRCAS